MVKKFSNIRTSIDHINTLVKLLVAIKKKKYTNIDLKKRKKLSKKKLPWYSSGKKLIDHPPKNSKTVNKLIYKIFPYSAIKKKAKGNPEYSVL